MFEAKAISLSHVDFNWLTHGRGEESEENGCSDHFKGCWFYIMPLWWNSGDLSEPGAISPKKITFLAQISYSDFSLQRTSWIRSSHKEIGIMPLIRCKIWKPAGWGLVHGGPYSNDAFQKWVHFWKKRNALLRCYRGLLVKERFCNDERIFGLVAGGIFNYARPHSWYRPYSW